MDKLFSNQVATFVAYMPLILANLVWSMLSWLLPSRLYAKDVSKDIVLITGAGSGLGRALALEFAKLGSFIVAWDINAIGLEQTRLMVQQIYEQQNAQHKEQTQKEETQKEATQKEETQKEATNNKCLTYLVDVSNRSAVQEGALKVNADLKRLHGAKGYVSILVNNAGIYHGLMLHELKDEQIERIFKINVMSHFWTVRAFIGDMIEFRRGHIVEIASMAGISGLQKQVDYCSSKFATSKLFIIVFSTFAYLYACLHDPLFISVCLYPFVCGLSYKTTLTNSRIIVSSSPHHIVASRLRGRTPHGTELAGHERLHQEHRGVSFLFQLKSIHRLQVKRERTNDLKLCGRRDGSRHQMQQKHDHVAWSSLHQLSTQIVSISPTTCSLFSQIMSLSN